MEPCGEPDGVLEAGGGKDAPVKGLQGDGRGGEGGAGPGRGALRGSAGSLGQPSPCETVRKFGVWLEVWPEATRANIFSLKYGGSLGAAFGKWEGVGSPVKPPPLTPLGKFEAYQRAQ